MHERPAAMRALHPAQISGDLRLQPRVHGFAEIVAQQDVFRRNGTIGLEFEHPVAIGLLMVEQRARRGGDGGLQAFARDHHGFITGKHLVQNLRLCRSA